MATKIAGDAACLLIVLPILVAFAKNRADILVFAILATTFMTVCNPALATKGFLFSILARVIYLLLAGVMIIQNIGRKRLPATGALLSMLIYLGYQAISSSQGFAPIISYLKLGLFSCVFIAFYGMANATQNNCEVGQNGLRNVVLIFSAFIIGGSMALIPFPGIGKMNAAQAIEQGLSVQSVGLFMGTTNQSQTLGVTVGVTAVFLFADLLFSLRRWDKLYVGLLLCAPILLFYSSSRTGMGTFLAGIVFTAFIFLHSQGINMRWKVRAMNIIMLFGLGATLFLFATPQMRENVAKFTLKWMSGRDAEVELSYENIASSRQFLIDTAIKNFKESPWLGNGFQVSEKYAGFEAQSWKQLLTAPIEKGIWVVAVLEEGGIIGMALFVLFLLIAFIGLLKYKAYIGTCVLFTFLMSNLGEFTLFSMSAAGGFFWALVFVGVALDAQRVRQEHLLRQQMIWRQTGGAMSRPVSIPTRVRE